MTLIQYQKAIESELTTLNQTIDRKIIYGLNYSDEARRHKMLRSQIRKARARRSRMFSQFGGIARFASFF